MEGRVDRLKGVNLRRSLDQVRQVLKHLRVGVGVVKVRIALVLPQSDCDRILAAGIGQRDFVLEALLLAEQRKNLVLEDAGVIRLHVGFQPKRDITRIHSQPPKVVAYKRKKISDGLTYVQGT